MYVTDCDLEKSRLIVDSTAVLWEINKEEREACVTYIVVLSRC